MSTRYPRERVTKLGGLDWASRLDRPLVERAALTRVHVRMSQELPRGFALSAGVDNVLDAVVEEYPGFLGRQLHLGVSWTGSREQ